MSQRTGVDELERLALEEIREEQLRYAIEAVKTRLRRHKPWWHWIFPYTIIIKRK